MSEVYERKKLKDKSQKAAFKADEYFDDGEPLVQPLRFVRTGEYINSFKQEFPQYRKQYRKVNNHLVEIGKIDIQEELNSNRSCALDVILDKFLNTGIVESSYVSGLNLDSFSSNDADVEDVDHEDDLIKISEALTSIEDLRKKYNLPLSYNAKQIVSYIVNANNKVVNNIEDLLKKGNDLNAKKNVNSSSINEELQENSQQDSQKKSS